jgi:ammonia channel protein AmtB
MCDLSLMIVGASQCVLKGGSYSPRARGFVPRAGIRSRLLTRFATPMCDRPLKRNFTFCAQFAIITPALVVGSFSERINFFALVLVSRCSVMVICCHGCTALVRHTKSW